MQSHGARAAAGRRLMVLDDCFPHPLSSFRFAELSGLLDAFPDASVHTSMAAAPFLGLKGTPSDLIASHTRLFPQDQGRIQLLHEGTSYAGQAAYCVFFQNMRAYVDVLDRSATPFAFTLYPGGSFYINEPAVDEKLKRIFDSPNFKCVIATQKITRDYLIEKGLCDEESVRLIHGGVMPPLALGDLPEKQYFGVHKKTVDICFAGWKYMALGRDKGFDTFIHAARMLAKRFAFAQFHVIGPWDEQEMDVSDLAGRIHFHAPMSSTDLRKFFRRIDLFVSPNRAFTLMPGKFDAFPLGCCVEAALSGVAVCATDELRQNLRFTHGKDVLLCGVEAEAVADMVGEAIANYDGLCELAEAGLRKFSEVFAWEAQMAPRLEVLSRLLSLPAAPPVPPPRPVPPLP